MEIRGKNEGGRERKGKKGGREGEENEGWREGERKKEGGLEGEGERKE